MDHDAVFRQAQSKRGPRACPSGGGFSEGGRVAKAAYSQPKMLRVPMRPTKEVQGTRAVDPLPEKR